MILRKYFIIYYILYAKVYTKITVIQDVSENLVQVYIIDNRYDNRVTTIFLFLFHSLFDRK